MTFNDEMKLRTLNTMQSRARNLPLMRTPQWQRDIDVLQKTNAMLVNQLGLVVAQRDALDRAFREFAQKETDRG